MSAELPRADLSTAFEELWSTLAAVCSDFDASLWDAPTRLAGWTVRDVVSHIIGTELMLSCEPTPSVAVPTTAHVRNEIGMVNERWVQQRRDRRGDEVLAEFEQVARRRLEVLGAMSQEQFDEEAWTPVGRQSYGRLMRIRVFDIWLHLLDITCATGLGRDVDVDSLCPTATRLALAEMGAMLPYVVGKRAAARLGNSVAVVVPGSPERRFDVLVEGRARLLAGPVLRPTVTLRCDAATLGALVGGRSTVGDELAGGRLELSGDEALATAVANALHQEM